MGRIIIDTDAWTVKPIQEIISVEKRKSAKGEYYVTLAVVDGSEVEGYSYKKDEYQVGDKVVFDFADRYNRAKMWKKGWNKLD